jgi:hypothetical protein
LKSTLKICKPEGESGIKESDHAMRMPWGGEGCVKIGIKKSFIGVSSSSSECTMG